MTDKSRKGRWILLVSTVPLSVPWNGADKNLARLLALRDQQNGYIVQTDDSEQWPDERIRVVRDRSASPFPNFRQRMKALIFMIQHTHQADLVHIVASVHRPNPLVGGFLRFWKRLTGRPLLHTALSTGDDGARKWNFPGDVTVVVSEYDRKSLAQVGVNHVKRIPPPLNWDTLENKILPVDVATRLQLGQRAILYPGHYGPIGGVAECIQAFASLPPELDDVVLVLACRTFPGQDPAVEAQRAHRLASKLGVADRVRVVGEFEDMAALILACTITVLVPAGLAGKMAIPLVLLESLALGRPIITSSKPPLNEALHGGGLTVPPGDAQALAKAMTKLLKDPDLRDQLGSTGCEAVRQACVPEKAVYTYQKIYARLTGDAA